MESPLPTNGKFGEYQLEKLLSHTPEMRTWLAEQTSIQRRVLIDELTDHRPHHHAAFLARARAMATVDFPKIGTVLEAVDDPEICYYAYELLAGSPLSQRQLAGETFQPSEIASILRQIAEANLYLERSGKSTTILTFSDIFLENNGIVHLRNLAIPGPRNIEQSIRDITHLGDAFRDLVSKDWPGTNRILTLLCWMRGEGIEQPLSWQQVSNTCDEITAQLKHSAKSQGFTFQIPRFVFPSIAFAALIGLAILGWILLPKSNPKPQRLPLPAPIHLSAGNYQTPDGLKFDLSEITLHGHLVTNAQYHEFLQILEALKKEGDQQLFDHPDQPPSKTHHTPAGWSVLASDLKNNGFLQDQPVTGIDWWDAQAFARWKKSRLPTQEEIFAALASHSEGSHYEWTQFPAANPSNPLGEKLWVLFSNKKPRQWTQDRTLRRTDLGFRIVEIP